MSDFDAAPDGEGAATIRSHIAFDDVAQVGNFGQGNIAFPVDVEIVVAVFIGTSGKIGNHRRVVIHDHRYVCPDWTEGTGACSQRSANFGFFGHAQWGGNFRQVFCLDGIEFVIATDDKGNDATFRPGDHQGFDGALNWHAIIFDQGGNGLAVRGFPFFHCSAWSGAGLGGALCLGFFDIGGIVAVGGKDNSVFACGRQNVEFV